MEATSSVVHLVSGHGSWGFQPLFHAILVSYVLLIPLSGSRTGGSACSLILGSDVGYMHPCIFSLACLPHADSCRSYRLAPLCVPIIHQSHSLTLLRLISSSSAGLYFLSSIIISPVSLLARMLEPLNFYPTHPSWPPTLEPSTISWILIRPDRHVCYDCLRPALDLAIALAKFLFVCTFSCEDTRPQALVLSRQPLMRALP